MSRLIDADAAYKAACEGADNWDGGCSPYRDDCIREEMDKVPTASTWHRVEDGLPMNKQNLLFVVHTPPYHHTELGEMPDTKKVVYGLFNPTPGYGRRWWSFEDEIGECVIINEYVKEDCGEETYITHWMPLPEPPKEEA